MYAVIDIGSNTVRMVLYKVNDNDIKPMMNNKYALGLAGYVQKDNNMSRKGIKLLIETLKEFRCALDCIDTIDIFIFATASLRKVKNREEVLKKVKKETDFDIVIISGKQEALYDYYGAMQNIKEKSGVLSDVGGGSTEIAVYTRDKIVNTFSMPIGSLSMFKECVKGFVPEQKELEKIKEVTWKNLKELKIPRKYNEKILCGIGGTTRASLKIINNLFNKPDDNSIITLEDYENIFEMFIEEKDELYKAILETFPDRFHTLLPGICIQKTTMEFLMCDEIIVSPSGVREGYLRYNVLKHD